MRATYVNQARVHQGYHYPRSLHTALKSAHCFQRFNEDYGFRISRSFKQVYGISSEMSWTNAGQFKGFCEAAGIPGEETQPARFFRNGLVDAAYVTKGCTYDARMLRDYLVAQISVPYSPSSARSARAKSSRSSTSTECPADMTNPTSLSLKLVSRVISSASLM